MSHDATASTRSRHDHEFWDCPTVHCSACVAVVKLDQDAEAAHHRERPRRRPINDRHVILLTLIRQYGKHNPLGNGGASFDRTHEWLADWVGRNERAYFTGLSAYSFGRSHPEMAAKAIAAGLKNGVE